jgi:hypothetical protein
MATDTTNQPLQEDGEPQVAAYVPISGPTSLGQTEAMTSSKWNGASTTTLEISGSLGQSGLSNRVKNISNQAPMEQVTVDPSRKPFYSNPSGIILIDGRVQHP